MGKYSKSPRRFDVESIEERLNSFDDFFVDDDGATDSVLPDEDSKVSSWGNDPAKDVTSGGSDDNKETKATAATPSDSDKSFIEQLRKSIAPDGKNETVSSVKISRSRSSSSFLQRRTSSSPGGDLAAMARNISETSKSSLSRLSRMGEKQPSKGGANEQWNSSSSSIKSNLFADMITPVERKRNSVSGKSSSRTDPRKNDSGGAVARPVRRKSSSQAQGSGGQSSRRRRSEPTVKENTPPTPEDELDDMPTRASFRVPSKAHQMKRKNSSFGSSEDVPSQKNQTFQLQNTASVPPRRRKSGNLESMAAASRSTRRRSGLQRKNSYSAKASEPDNEAADRGTTRKDGPFIGGSQSKSASQLLPDPNEELPEASTEQTNSVRQKTYPRRRHSWGSADLIIAASNHSQSGQHKNGREGTADVKARRNSKKSSVPTTGIENEDDSAQVADSSLEMQQNESSNRSGSQTARRGAVGSSNGTIAGRRLNRTDSGRRKAKSAAPSSTMPLENGRRSAISLRRSQHNQQKRSAGGIGSNKRGKSSSANGLEKEAKKPFMDRIKSVESFFGAGKGEIGAGLAAASSRSNSKMYKNNDHPSTTSNTATAQRRRLSRHDIDDMLLGLRRMTSKY